LVITSEPLDRIWLPFWVWVRDKTNSEPTETFTGSNVPTFPFALPTGGAEPSCVSQSYPEKVNSLGPVTEDGLVPEEPLLEVPPPEDPLAVPLPEEPLLEVPLPEDPLAVPLPDDPLLEPPLPEAPIWAGVESVVPPPHPARKTMVNRRNSTLSMKNP
jgi:hypothetical protein